MPLDPGRVQPLFGAAIEYDADEATPSSVADLLRGEVVFTLRDE
jgi:hypothetical protein